MTESIIIAVLGSGVLSALIASVTTLIVKILDRKNRLSKLEKKAAKAELDNVRLQIMLLMSDFPDEQQEILRVAEHYFKDLHGNWYMTSMFNNWLLRNEIAKPEWFGGANE